MMVSRQGNTEVPTAPAWKWEMNPNTIFQVVQLVVLMGGGIWFLGGISAATEENTKSISALISRVGVLETDSRKLDTHTLRIENLERQVLESAQGMRAVDQNINQLASDIRLVREILQRLENGSSSSSLSNSR